MQVKVKYKNSKHISQLTFSFDFPEKLECFLGSDIFIQ